MSTALPDALSARLADEETKLLRVIHRFIPITEQTFVDEAGEMLIPRGQSVTLRLVPSDGKVTLLHSCLVGTPAEIDFLLRARHFYLAHASAMNDVVPVLVTLNIDPILKAAAANAGINVATVLIGNEQAPTFDLTRSGSSPSVPLSLSSSGQGRAASTQSPKRDDAPKSPLANGTGFSSAAYKVPAKPSPLSVSTTAISSLATPEPVGRAHSATDISLEKQPPGDASRAPSMSDPPQKKSAATLSPAPTPPSPSPVPGTPKAAPATVVAEQPTVAPRSAAVLAWRAFLAASGIETPLVPTLADAIAARGILLPSNPADMPWEKLKETDGIKMGHITRMKKYAASRTPS